MMDAADESTEFATKNNQENRDTIREEEFVEGTIAPAPASAPPAIPASLSLDNDDCDKQEHQERMQSYAEYTENDATTKDHNYGMPPLIPMGAKSADSNTIEGRSLNHHQPLLSENRTISIAEESLASLDFEDGADEPIEYHPPALSAPSVASLPQKWNKQIQTRLSMDERTLSHERLKSFEAKRRTVYEPKVRSSSTYWYVCQQMLHSSMEETRRVEVLIRAAVLADVNYVNHISAALEGTLHPDGSPMASVSSQQTATAKEASRQATVLMHDNKNEDAQDGTSTEVPVNGSNKIYWPFEQYLREMSSRFGEEARLMQEGVVAQIINLREKLDKDVSSMVLLGDAIHEELNAAEETVKDSWSCYYESAFKSLSGMDDEDEQISDDVWLAECNYRLAVRYQSEAWTAVGPELSNLFSSMKQMELFRRSIMKEMLIWTMQQKDRVYFGLHTVAAPSIRDLTEFSVDSETIDAELKKSVHERAQQYILTSRHNLELNGGGEDSNSAAATTDQGLSDADLSLEANDMDSPLTSSLMKHIKVVQRKASRIGGGWKTTLAIITADSFLHLFDVPPTVLKAKLGDGIAFSDTSIEPRAVFRDLLPSLIVPTKDSIHEHGKGPFFFASSNGSGPKVPNVKLVPNMTIMLPNSDIHFTEGKHQENSTFEVIETRRTRGASKLLHKTSHRKLQLRTSSRSETMDWIYHMNVSHFLIKAES